MAVDFEAIRRKLSQISGQNKSRDAFWKPAQDVQYKIRVLPFTDNEGQPFKERWFYYGIGKTNGLLTPHQFGKKDPFQDLITKLREDGTKESYEMAKKLYPKMRAYAAVIVRGEEDKGPRLWAFGKSVYQDILAIMLDEDYGDVSDPLTGRDLKVTVSKAIGADFAKTDVMPTPRTSKLSDDQALAKQWLSSIPNIDDHFSCKSYEELEKIINEWLSNGPSNEGNDHTNEKMNEKSGTEKGGKKQEASSESELDKVAASLKSGSKPKKDKVHSDLDDAFADLVNDDE